MMVVHRAEGTFEHAHIKDLPGRLRRGDLLVVNNTRVIPARVFGRREDTGGRVELLLIEETGGGVWEAFCRMSAEPAQGMRLALARDNMSGEICGVLSGGRVRIRLSAARPVREILDEEGYAPVPPYIKRPPDPASAGEGPRSGRSGIAAADLARYQTVYAKWPGAVAAPTAGLHFTRELLEELHKRGTETTEITLHVGPGTFKPAKTEWVADHRMESERYVVGEQAVADIERARSSGGRVVGVGTTVVRTLESVARERGVVEPCRGRTSLFIHPPFDFRAVDVMLTNFHLPRSTLIMMVSAFAHSPSLPVGERECAGRELILRAYEEAIREKYRFYSYGDCMLIV